jgi:hypothetical protein
MEAAKFGLKSTSRISLRCLSGYEYSQGAQLFERPPMPSYFRPSERERPLIDIGADTATPMQMDRRRHALWMDIVHWPLKHLNFRELSNGQVKKNVGPSALRLDKHKLSCIRFHEGPWCWALGQHSREPRSAMRNPGGIRSLS